MCTCKEYVGGEWDEILTEVCDECLDRDSFDGLLESQAEALQENADLLRELVAEWTGANLAGAK